MAPDLHADHSENLPLLQIRGLFKAFGGVQAIYDLDLSIRKGEVFSVIGPNGSGKTTLFNVVTGLIPADAGQILWGGNGVDLVGKKPWHVFGLGIARTFQNIRLPLGLSVLDNVMVGLYPHTCTNWAEMIVGTPRVKRREEQARERALEALRFMGGHLVESAGRLIAELSYPDRRRVEIARAIVSNPSLLLLDEPTAGMNRAETAEIAEEILKVNSTGMSILLIEHKMRFVADLAQRIAVLNFGRKIAEGSYSEIRSDKNVIEAYLGSRKD